MSKLSEGLRAMGIFNTHELLKRFGVKGKDVAVSYCPPLPRMVQAARSYVYSPSHKTDEQAGWYDYGRKAFIGKQAESMPRALAWASELYEIDEWAPDPTSRGSKVPKYVADAARAAVNDREER